MTNSHAPSNSPTAAWELEIGSWELGGQKSLQANAAIALLLAISGVYSVVAFAVARRRREIAIRVAMGGTRSSIVVMLLVRHFARRWWASPLAWC